MKSELSRRDFIKVAATGLGALAFGGLLSACSGEKDARCDPEHAVTLKAGEYVLVGDYKIYLLRHEKKQTVLWVDTNTDLDYALFFIWNEKMKKPETYIDAKIAVGEVWLFDQDQQTEEYRRAIYRCDYDTFAFWDLKEFPKSTPTPTMTPIPTHTQIPPPKAIFP